MKKTFTISIPKPCHEKWDKFKPTTLGGFCSSCQKEVIDFTTWDEDRIKSYFTNRSQTSCGRFNSAQLKTYTLIEAPRFNFAKWTYAPLVSLVMLLFSRNAEAQVKLGEMSPKKIEIKKQFDASDYKQYNPDSLTRKITGVVTSLEDGSALPGVYVILKGTSIGASTDINGKYSINLPDSIHNPALVFSFIGLEAQEISIGERSTIDVSLALDLTQLAGDLIIYRRFSLRNLGWRIGNLFRRN